MAVIANLIICKVRHFWTAVKVAATHCYDLRHDLEGPTVVFLDAFFSSRDLSSR